jgi:hypothetical protein
MRRIVLKLLLALSSLAFAPAPFPRPRGGEASEAEQQRVVRAYQSRLGKLGLTCELVVRDGVTHLHFGTRNPKGGGVERLGSYRVRDGDVAGALRLVIEYLQSLKGRASPP